MPPDECSTVKWPVMSLVTRLGSPPGAEAHIGQTTSTEGSVGYRGTRLDIVDKESNKRCRCTQGKLGVTTRRKKEREQDRAEERDE